MELLFLNKPFEFVEWNQKEEFLKKTKVSWPKKGSKLNKSVFKNN